MTDPSPPYRVGDTGDPQRAAIEEGHRWSSAGIGVPLLAATLAQRLRWPGFDHPVRRRRDRCLCRAGQAAAIHQRSALHQARQHGAGQRRSAAAAAARLCRHRFHGWRADRQVRQSELLVHRRFRSSENPLPGTGGGNDISSLTNMIVAMKHESAASSTRWISSPARASSAAARPAPKAACRKVACSASSLSLRCSRSTKPRA